MVPQINNVIASGTSVEGSGTVEVTVIVPLVSVRIGRFVPLPSAALVY